MDVIKIPVKICPPRRVPPCKVTLKVIGIDTDRFATYDLLLTFNNNQGPISYRFRGKRRFQSKIAIFFPSAAAEWVPQALELGSGALSQKLE